VERVGSATSAEGIEVRALSVHHSLVDEQAFQVSEIDNASLLTIFPAYETALHFHYLQWLHDNRIFDYPHKALTTEAVDRLFTIGWLDLVDHFDSVLACALLGHGAYRRIHRLSGAPTYDGKILQSQGNWMISPDARPPTSKQIDAFIREQEEARESNENNDGCRVNGYRLLFSQRPARDLGWEKQRLVQHGYWGLRCMGRDDDMAGAMIEYPDSRFKPAGKHHEQIVDNQQETCLTAKPVSTHIGTPRGKKRQRDSSPDDSEDAKETAQLPNRSPRDSQITSEVVYEDRQETCLPMDTTSAQPGTVDDPASDSRKRSRDSFEDTSEDVGHMITQPDVDEERQETYLPMDTVSALARTSARDSKRQKYYQFPGMPEEVRRSARIENSKKEAAAKKAA
ncbi:hypothetical protein DFH11DRAFT_1606765, partial [Phellopilus nigrolimitatus]